MTFAVKLAETAAIIEKRLDRAIAQQSDAGTPKRLLAAMRQALLGGGKRFRPFLVLETTELLGGPHTSAVECAAALEAVHCYSLVHDDLPSMDNDEMRRGSPTIWKAFDEWTAILVGDALQALAFELVSSAPCHSNPTIRCELVRRLAIASGSGGMVGGQALDLEAERNIANIGDEPSVPDIKKLQAMKTGRLITFASEAGAILSNSDETSRQALREFGDNLGLAFQIADDLLDVEGCRESVGKAVAKDAQLGKATLVDLLGVEAARKELAAAEHAAVAALENFGPSADVLRQAARYVSQRRS